MRRAGAIGYGAIAPCAARSRLQRTPLDPTPTELGAGARVRLTACSSARGWQCKATLTELIARAEATEL
jgi:hypothetical protein